MMMMMVKRDTSNQPMTSNTIKSAITNHLTKQSSSFFFLSSRNGDKNNNSSCQPWPWLWWRSVLEGDKPPLRHTNDGQQSSIATRGNNNHCLYHLIIIKFIIIQMITIIKKYLYPKWTKYRLHWLATNDKFDRNRSLLFLSVILCSLPSLAVSECRFPEQWLGSWFQKGVSETIYITRNNISNKGLCRKNVGEKYIIENRMDKCLRCLVFTERHANILQYKESFYCSPLSDNTNDVCSEITGDAPLYSLFRVNTSPIKCPFKGPFTFSYSKGNLNECKDPLSTIDECTDDRHMLFKFKACIDIPGSESKVEKLECIAEWKEGSNRYLVGKLYHQLSTTDEDRFRCFVIEKNNSDLVESYNIGQSGDASCDLLFSPRDGARTFKLRKAGQVKPLCDFPPWLLDAMRWTTLDNRYVYDFTALNQFTVLDMKNEVFRTGKCIRHDDVSFLYRFNTSRFIIHTTVQCSSGYACMHAYQRDDRIIELQIGNIVSHYSDVCSPINFNPRSTHYITLTTLDQETRNCELSGIYSIRTRMPFTYGTSNIHTNNNNRIIANYSRLVSFLDSRFMCQEKALKLKSNCDEPNLFQLFCTTDNRVKNFYCRGGWRENNTQYILLSQKDRFNYEYCLAYNIDSQEIRLTRQNNICHRHESVPDWSTEPFRPPPIPDSNYHKYTPKYDDSLSYTMINEGSCQRSGSLSQYHSLLSSTISIIIFFSYWMLIDHILGQIRT